MMFPCTNAWHSSLSYPFTRSDQQLNLENAALTLYLSGHQASLMFRQLASSSMQETDRWTWTNRMYDVVPWVIGSAEFYVDEELSTKVTTPLPVND
jgi:hypothetical protein